MEGKLKVAFIGTGWVCQNRHLPAFSKLKDVTLLGIIDPDEKKAEKVAGQWKMPYYSSAGNVEEITWFAEADAVVVTSPPMTHYHWIRQSLLAGKHVLTEKPFSTQRNDARELLELALEKGLKLCVVHNTLYSRAQKKARKWIEEGKIGQVTGLSISLLNNPNRHLPAWYDELPFGLLFDETSHFLYTSDSLTKNLKVVSGEAYNSRNGLGKTPSKAKVSLISDDFPVFFSLDFEAPVCEWHITIQGTKGLIDVDNFRDIVMFVPNDRKHEAKDHLRTIYHFVSDLLTGFVKAGIAHVRGKLLYGMEDVAGLFVQSVKSNAPSPYYISGEFGVRISNLLFDMIDCLEKGKNNTEFLLNMESPKLGTQ